MGNYTRSRVKFWKDEYNPEGGEEKWNYGEIITRKERSYGE